MSQKYTREQIIKDRRCGLKTFDAVVAKMGNNKGIIDEAIKIFRESPDISPRDPWERMGWANANAIMMLDMAYNKNRNSIPVSANLDEMYDEADMLYLAAVAGISLPDTSARKRKKS